MAKPAILLNAPFVSAAVAKTTNTRKNVRTASSAMPCARVKSPPRSGVIEPRAFAVQVVSGIATLIR